MRLSPIPGGRGMHMLVLIAALSVLISPHTPATARKHPTARSLQLPLTFEANRGQTDDRVAFLARGPGYGIFLTATEAVLTLTSAASERPVVHMQLVGSAATPQAEGEGALAGKVNYFRGRDSAGWRTGVPTWQRVKYPAVYPGIDLVYHGRQQQLEYDFIVAPGADPGRIELAFSGARQTTVDAQGDLVLETAAGAPLRFRKPVVYQADGAHRRRVDGGYVQRGAHRIGFRIAAYDRTRPLIIDPVLSYSTYLGGSGADAEPRIAVDATGAAYVVGWTSSVDFPTANALQPAHQGDHSSGDMFVAKLTPDGSALVYATYLGGSDSDAASDIAVDSAGAAYICGSTNSSDFPTVNAFQPAFAGGSDGVVAKLSADGSQLVYSTYLGGGSYDNAYAIAVDSNGAAYVGGGTSSEDFPVLAAIQSFAKTSGDAFVTKLAPDGSALVYSTYLGSKFTDYAQDIAVDSLGAAYVVGFAESEDFPSVNPLPYPTPGDGWYGFVSKFTPDGSSLVYSTRLGGGTEDFATGVSVDASGAAYVTGRTRSHDFPTVNPLQSLLNGDDSDDGETDAFVVKIAPEGGALIYGTYLGGLLSEFGTRIAVDAAGSAYVSGSTTSANFSTTNPVQADAGGADAFFAKLTPDGASLVYSSYLGGAQEDRGTDIALDDAGNTYLAGYTRSQDFPTTPNALQPAFAGDDCDINDSDAFIVKITEDNLAPAELRSVGSDPAKAGSRDPRGAGAMDAAFLAMLALLACVAVLRRRES